MAGRLAKEKTGARAPAPGARGPAQGASREIAATGQEIDELVYELYGITDEERKIIETYRNFRSPKLRLFQVFADASQRLQEKMWKSRKIEVRILRYFDY